MKLNDNQLKVKEEIFDGEMFHPSLDIKDDILVIGFRYRSKPNEEKEMFLVVDSDNNIGVIKSGSFKRKDKSYFFEKKNRKLMSIEEKWSLLEFNKFLDNYYRADIPPREVFNQVVGLTKKYIELEKDIDYVLLSAWIIGTYFYPIFYAYPFLNVKAPKRSGKSQCLNLLSQLCFNAIKARPSLAALSDTVDALRGTYLIDQADSLSRKGGEDLLDILADSYKKGGGKRRVANFDRKRGREVLEFETYSPKVFASIKELPEDLRDRCLTIPLIRSQRNFPDPDDSNENWREIRGKLYQLLITNYRLVRPMYSVRKIEHNNKQEILGRSLELWLPFEVILECSGMQESIPESKKRFLSGYGFTEYEPSELEEEVIKAVLSYFEDKEEVVLTPKGISEIIDEDAFPQGDTPKQKAAKVGWAIKKFNLASEKKPRTKDGVCYLFEKKKIENIHNSYCGVVAEHTLPTPMSSDGLNTEEIVV